MIPKPRAPLPEGRAAGLISVVVPIYNVAPYLHDCLDSLRRQRYPHLQVILVDDGSTDHSGAIAEEFVARDPRFQLVRQANGGLAAARNTGISHAHGELLAFVDSDDVLPAYAYELLTLALQHSDADFVTGSATWLSFRGTRGAWPHREIFTSSNLHTHVSADKRLLRDRTVWNKLFRRRFWDEHGFAFPEGRLFEDTPVSLPAHVLAREVAVVHAPVYHWRRRVSGAPSITQLRGHQRTVVDRFRNVVEFGDFLADRGLRGLKESYEVTALWDEIGHLLADLPDADEVYRSTLIELAMDLSTRLEPGALARLHQPWRGWWTLAFEGRLDELDAAMWQERRAEGSTRTRVPGRAPPVISALHEARWQHGSLVLRGHAYIDGAGAARPWSSVRVLQLREPGTRRRLFLPTRNHHDPSATAIARDERYSCDWSGFEVAIDPRRLRSRGEWPAGLWSVSVLAAGGRRIARSGLAVGTDAEPVRLAVAEVAPGVRVAPVVIDRVLRLRVERPWAWVTEVRLIGGELEVRGEVRGAPGDRPELRLARTRTVPTHTVPTTVRPLEDGRHGFAGRVPLAALALDDPSAAHRSGLDNDRFMVEFSWAGQPSVHLAATVELPAVRLRCGTDEVYTHVSASGYLWVCTRPAGPTLTDARWRPDGGLELTGDAPGDTPGELLLRRRDARREAVWPLTPDHQQWRVNIRPDAVAGCGGALPLEPGVWDLAVRIAGSPVVTALGVAAELLHRLPLRTDSGERRLVLDGVYAERAALRVDEELTPAERGPYNQARLRARARAARLREAVLFDAYSGRQCSDSPRAVLDELVRRGAPLGLEWTVQDGQALTGPATPLRQHGTEWHEAIAMNRFVVTNGPLPSWFSRRPGQVVIQTGRGHPIRRVGLAARHVRDPVERAHIRADASNWSALVASSRSATEVLRPSFEFDGEVLELGRPANDALVRADGAGAVPADEVRSDVLRRLGLPPGSRLVLYAPTWRYADVRASGRVDAARLLDLPAMAAGLPDGHVLLVRRHPMLLDDIAGTGDRIRDVSTYPDVVDLLAAADLLVTDYSSVMADFVLTGRPILLYVPDLADFDERTGLTIDLATRGPGPLLSSTAELVEAVREVADLARAYHDRYRAFATSCADLDDGNATGRLVDWMLARG